MGALCLARGRFAAAACAFGMVFGLAALPASAQTFDRVITFGDSLSDNGNVFNATGTPPPPYFAGRFSNGPVWAELLNGPMSQPLTAGTFAGNLNFAFGGAVTGGLVGLPPSIEEQVAGFNALAGIAYPGLSANDLVTVWGGANDMFAVFAGPPPSQTDIVTAAQTAAGNIVGSTGILAAQAPGAILVGNLPNLGGTPLFNGTTSGILGGFTATSAFNAALLAGLEPVAAANPQTNIIILDTEGAFAYVTRRPGDFGLTNTTDPCFDGVSVCANPDEYLFWDDVHPTAVVHEQLALLANLSLNYAAAGAVTANVTETGLWARTAASDWLLDRLDASLLSGTAFRSGVFAEGVARSAEVGATGTAAGYDYAGGGLRAGVQMALGEGVMAGGAVGLTQFHVDGAGFAYAADYAQFDLFGAYRSGAFFIKANLGGDIAMVDDYERATGFGRLNAAGSPNGSTVGAAGELGLLWQMGGVTISPALGLRYTISQLDAYEESADVLALEFEERTDRYLTGGVSLALSAALDPGSLKGLTAYGRVGYEDLLSADRDDIRVTLANNTAQVQGVSLDDPNGFGLNVELGLSGETQGGTVITGQYQGAFDFDDSSAHSLSLHVASPF